MSEAQLNQVSSGRDRGEMDELKKLILSEKARTKHHADGGGGGGGGKGERQVDGGDGSDDDDGEMDARDRGGDGRGRGVGGAREKKQKGTWRRGKLIIANDDDGSNKYRDRAEERRKGHNPDYADKLNQMASMDAETSKYLGGDVEHTHLVKGLDYALLVKIRDEQKQRQSEVSYDGGRGGLDGDRNVMRAEVRARTLMGKTVLAVLRKLHMGEGAGGPDFKRVNYEFDLDPESMQEIPTAVAHSLGDEGGEEEEEEDRERHTNYLMQEDLLERVESSFTHFRQHGGKARRQRKRARDKTGGNEADAIVAALAKTGGGSGGHGSMDMDTEEDVMRGGNGLPPSQRTKVSINIFEDVDDRYAPPGSSGAAVSANAPAGEGYFSGLRASKTGEASDSKGAGAHMPSRAEMSATVKAAARAAAARLAGGDANPTARGGASGRASASAGGGGAAGRGAAGAKQKIDRDIFAARPSRGQALGVAAGGYDVYPETGDFETYDSDEDATNKKDAKPGPEGGGAASGGGGGSTGGSRRSGTSEHHTDNHPGYDKPKASFPFGVKRSEMSGRKQGRGKGGGSKHRVDNELNIINKYMKGAK